MSVAAFFLIILLIAGVVLIWEARTGQLTPRTSTGATIRTTLFFVAAVVGGAMLMRTASASLLLSIALVPVTGLSLYRFVMLVRPALQPVRALVPVLIIVMALVVGMTTSYSMLPKHLDQQVIIEQIFMRESPPAQRSIDPAARRVVRA